MVGLVGGFAVTALTKTPWGFVAAGIVGCGTGLASQAVEDALTDEKSSAGTYWGKCGAGALMGAAGFGLGRMTAAA